MRPRRLRDPVHKDIHLEGDELRVLDTLAMQRLRGIRQLGAAFFVYPGAQHSRFEHCVGTCWMAKRILERLQSQSALPEVERRGVCLASLVHDVTHIPFGHTFEDERKLLEKHDKSQSRFDYFLNQGELAEVLDESEAGRLAKAILSPARPPGPQKRYLHDIVTGTICADLLDYLKRDNYFCGLSHDFDERVFHYFSLAHGRLCLELGQHGLFRRDALSEITNLLRIRYVLTERVYYHHAKIAAGVMISKAIEQAMKLGLQQEDLNHFTDESLLYHLERDYGKDPGIGELIGSFRARQLFKRSYLLTRDVASGEIDELVARYHLNESGARSEAETRIADALGVQTHQVAIYCAPAEMALKEAEVPVLTPAGALQPLAELNSAEVNVLKDQHRALWKFYLFVARPLEHMAERAAAACEELTGLPNQLPREIYGRMP